MTPIIDLLTDYGPMLLAGSTVLLAVGTIAMALFGRPVQRQRLGELTLAATMAWLLLACVPLPRWDLGADRWIASGRHDTYPIEEPRAHAQGSLGEPLSNSDPEPTVGVSAAEEGSQRPEDVAHAGANSQPSTAGDFFGATGVSTLESSPVAARSRVGWRRTLAVSYGLGVVGCMIWLLAGHVLLARNERIATAPEAWLEDVYDSATGGRDVKRARLLISRACRRPAVYGIWRPLIILPRELCRPENSERLRHVLRHESAHVWRGDARGNLIINGAFPFLFFHPLFWWLRHRIQFSRELIADDWAAGLSSKESYADELLQLVSQGRGMRLGTIGVLGVFRFNTPFYRRMKMLIDRKKPLATTLPLTWQLFGILVGVMVVTAMVCVAGVEPAADEGGSPAAVQPAESEILDEPFEGEGTADASPAEKHPRQSLEEMIRAALKALGATVRTEVDPKTGGVSVTIEVPAAHFSRVWQQQQKKNGRGSGRMGGMGMGGGMGEESGAMSGMMMGGGMGEQSEDMGGMGMMMGDIGMMDMGTGSIYGLQIPRDQLNKVQIEETEKIRDTVTDLLTKMARAKVSISSLNVSVVRDIRLNKCLVTLIDDVAVPAQVEGPVVELAVREGDRVKRGQILARIDDRRAKLKLDEAKGLLEETQGNNLDVKYAEVSLKVASADYDAAFEANQKISGTLSKSEIRRLALLVEQYQLQVEQARYAQVVTRAQKAQLALAETELSNYRAQAPIDGIVIEVFAHVGEWVRSGDPICHIVRTDRLRVETHLDLGKYSPHEFHGSDVIIEVKSLRGTVEQIPGKVTFVSPLVEMDSRCKMVAEVSNRTQDGQYLLRPGMQVTMVVKLTSRPRVR